MLFRNSILFHLFIYFCINSFIVKLGIGGFSMGVATALYSATCFAQGKYGNGIDYPVNLRAIVGLSGWLPGSRYECNIFLLISSLFLCYMYCFPMLKITNLPNKIRFVWDDSEISHLIAPSGHIWNCFQTNIILSSKVTKIANKFCTVSSQVGLTHCWFINLFASKDVMCAPYSALQNITMLIS